jgi:hypothetical protein
MKPVFCILCSIILLACGSSPLVKHLDGSDRVAVQFKYPGTDSVIKVVEATQRYAVEKLLRFADGKESKQFKCGYDGNMLFYKNGVLTGDIAFNYNTDGCHHFLHMVDGKLTATEMNNEAVDFLRSLANQLQ